MQKKSLSSCSLFFPTVVLMEKGQTNLLFKESQVELIRDMRGEESLYSLDAQGFAFKADPTYLRDLSVHENIENLYLSEMGELLKSSTDVCVH